MKFIKVITLLEYSRIESLKDLSLSAKFVDLWATFLHKSICFDWWMRPSKREKYQKWNLQKLFKKKVVSIQELGHWKINIQNTREKNK